MVLKPVERGPVMGDTDEGSVPRKRFQAKKLLNLCLSLNEWSIFTPHRSSKVPLPEDDSLASRIGASHFATELIHPKNRRRGAKETSRIHNVLPQVLEHRAMKLIAARTDR